MYQGGLLWSSRMAPRMDVLLFGDQTSDCRFALRWALQQKKNVILTSFFERVGAALRHEVSRQPRLVRNRIPEFTSIKDLLERYDELQSANPILDSTLMCICQLASFIRYGYPWAWGLSIWLNDMLVAILRRTHQRSSTHPTPSS